MKTTKEVLIEILEEINEAKSGSHRYNEDYCIALMEIEDFIENTFEEELV